MERTAREALAAGDWAAARAGFDAAVGREPTADALDGLSQALFSAGEYGAAIERGEQAFAAYRTEGDDERAASVARFVGYLHAVVHGNRAVAGGWMGRAVRLVDSVGDCPERARLELTRAVVATDAHARERHIAAAEDAAAHHGLTDIVMEAMSQRGLHLVLGGEVDAGFGLLDEALAAVAGGEVRDLVSVGAMYCKMLHACELAHDVRRAEEWLAEADRFVVRTNRIPIGAICRTHFGGVLVAAGRWDEADHELSTALALYDRSYRALRGAAVVRSALLRVRQGRLSDAAMLLDGTDDAYAVRPTVELHLARGEPEAAATTAERHRRSQDEFDAPLLLLAVRAELACGRRDAAAAVAMVLRGHPRSTTATAYAEHAAGLVSTDPATAAAHLENAVAGLGAPLEEARARLDLATVLASGRPTLAAVEARTALDRFRALGAARDIDAAAALLRTLGHKGGHSPARGDGTLTTRERHVLDLLVEGLTNPAIAARLHLSRRTVEHHVSNILAKLGAATRAEAVALRRTGR